MALENLGVKLYSGTKADRKSDSLGSAADGSNNGITINGLGNNEADDVAHFEESSGILNKIIGEKITSGNDLNWLFLKVQRLSYSLLKPYIEEFLLLATYILN